MNNDYLRATISEWADRDITSVSVMGAGWHGLPLAVKLARSGLTLKASTTSSSKIPIIALGGVIPYLLEMNSTASADWSAFFRANALVITVPPSALLSGVKRLISFIESSPIRRIVYISSTAVYPEETGFYSESMAVHRVSKHSGIDLLALENTFRKLRGKDVSVLRFGGLFGPNRHPAGFFPSGRILPNPEGNVNMLHLEDAVNAVICTLFRSGGGDVFNVCSPEKVSRRDFYSTAFSLNDLRIQGFSEGIGNSRTIDVSAIGEKLGFEFRFSSALDALRHL